LKLIFLGTGAGRPTLRRNVTSVALLFPQAGNRFWLFDAGEGTQQQLLRAKLKLSKLDRIFVTHMHGDHVFGLPGLLTTRSYDDGASKLTLYGPPGLRAFVEGALRHSQAHLSYELDVVEIEAGPVLSGDGDPSVAAGELRHRTRCFGYRIEEPARPGTLLLPRLAELGLRPGPLYGKLKRGEDVAGPDGTIIRAADVVGPPVRGRVVAVLGDTSPCEEAVRLAQDANLLVHEATFAAGMEEKASAYGHSTIVQAARAAAEARARKLIVTHFSGRYDDEAVARMIADGQAVFPNIEAAGDLMEVSVPAD